MKVESVGVVEEIEVLRLEVRMLREELGRLWVKRKEELERLGEHPPLTQHMDRRKKVRENVSPGYRLIVDMSLSTPQKDTVTGSSDMVLLGNKQHSIVNDSIDKDRSKPCVLVSDQHSDYHLPINPSSPINLANEEPPAVVTGFTEQTLKSENVSNIVDRMKTQVLAEVRESRKFPCNFCDKTYTTANRLAKHVKNKHEDLHTEQDVGHILSEPKLKKFNCPLCDWKGVNAGVVKTHIKRKHI